MIDWLNNYYWITFVHVQAKLSQGTFWGRWHYQKPGPSDLRPCTIPIAAAPHNIESLSHRIGNTESDEGGVLMSAPAASLVICCAPFKPLVTVCLRVWLQLSPTACPLRYGPPLSSVPPWRHNTPWRHALCVTARGDACVYTSQNCRTKPKGSNCLLEN